MGAAKYDHIDFKPPEAVANAAIKGLEYRSRQGKDKAGLTPSEASKEGIGSGVQRATNLKNRDHISPEVVRQMAAFFSRHEKNKSIDPKYKAEPWRDKGHVAWLLWGGDPGRTWVEKIVKQMESADVMQRNKEAADEYTKGKPSLPHRTDRSQPTNENLWQDVLAVASGDRRELRIGDRTIHSPNEGRGFRNMPHNPQGISWAVKQYKGFGGGWKEASAMLKVEFQTRASSILDAGGILAIPHSNEQERLWMARLVYAGCAEKVGENERETLWVRKVGSAEDVSAEDFSSGGIMFLTKLSKGIKGKVNMDHLEDALKPLGFKFEKTTTGLKFAYGDMTYWWKNHPPALLSGVSDLLDSDGKVADFETLDEAERAIEEFKRKIVVVPSKGPARPEEGKLYAQIEWAKVFPPYGKDRYTARIALGTAWVGVPGWQIVSPKGHTLDIPAYNTNGREVKRSDVEFAPVWTFLYKKCGAQALALEMLAKLGTEIVEGAKPKPKDLRNYDGTGTCGCCEENIKLSKGRIMRHGWSVEGARYKGSYGGSWHSGPCQGYNTEPWEVSPQGAKDYLKWLKSTAYPMVKAEEARLKARPKRLAEAGMGYGNSAERVYYRDDDDPELLKHAEGKSWVVYENRRNYDYLLKSKISRVEREVELLEWVIGHFEDKIPKWAPAELPSNKNPPKASVIAARLNKYYLQKG